VERIGVDLGGTKIEGILLGEEGRELRRLRRPTPRGDYRATLEAIRSLVLSLEEGFGGGASVGLGMPGAISPATGLVKNSNSTWLIGRPLQDDLERLLDRPIRCANDANCFALSEAIDGAAGGLETVFGVILGTGTGGGVVIGGRVLAGINAIAGEWGHNPMPWPEAGEWPGPPCYCGRTGCIEVFLSGPGMERDHRGVTGEELRAPEIGRRAEAGETGSRETLERYSGRLARALASVINVLDPDAIVLGGGLSNLASLYGRVPELWGPHVFSDRVDTPLLPPRHGDSSGVRGAARLWDQRKPQPGPGDRRAP
jgi:fructokinase